MLRLLQNISNRQVLIILLSISVVTSAISAIVNLTYNISNTPDWWMSWFQGVSTELFGAFLTFILLELLVRNRELKERLIRQMRSKDNALALQAVAELGAHGWLGDGSLIDCNLWNANLEGVHMWDTDLRKVDLHGANFQQSNLKQVNFKGANLWKADFNGAILRDVNLEHADLYAANLMGVKLSHVEFDVETRLPDGNYWTNDTDLTQFGVIIQNGEET